MIPPGFLTRARCSPISVVPWAARSPRARRHFEPFVEPVAADDVEALVERFSTELNAVAGNVYRLVSDKLAVCRRAGYRYRRHLPLLRRHQAGPLQALHCSRIWISQRTSLHVGCPYLLLPRAVQPATNSWSRNSRTSGAGVTAVDYAIAETGTIVLSSDEQNALLVSLLPTMMILLCFGRTRSAPASLK